MPVPEHLLDRDEVDAALVVPGGAGAPQRVRAEPHPPGLTVAVVGPGRGLFQVEQAGQPVADRAAVDPAAAFVAEQRRAVAEPGADLIQIPPQDQVQAIQHRHPPRPRTGCPRSLAEPDMQLAERAPAKMHVGPVHGGGLLRAQPAQIQGPEQCVVASRRRVLAGASDPFLEEIEELLHPLRARRRVRRRGVRADVTSRIELIHRTDQPHPECRLDLTRLARDKERVEALERLHVTPPGRGGQPLRAKPRDDPVHVFPGDVPGWPAARSQEPFQDPGPVVHRGLAETAGNLRVLECQQAAVLKSDRISGRPAGCGADRTTRDQAKPVSRHAHLLPTLRIKARHLTGERVTLSITTRRNKASDKLAGDLPDQERVPSAGEWQATTLASSRIQVTPSSVLPATRMPGRAPCRAAICAQARRRAAFTAAVILPSARSPPRAISSSVRHAVGTEATSPNRPSWSPITRKSLITSAPSAIAQARSASTRPRSWTSSRSEASAFDSPAVRPMLSASALISATPACDTIPVPSAVTCRPFSQPVVFTYQVLHDLGRYGSQQPLSSQVRSTFHCCRTGQLTRRREFLVGSRVTACETPQNLRKAGLKGWLSRRNLA